ncbi:MAG: CHY zinc finger protein [Pyrinomonadaceae bacterium]
MRMIQGIEVHGSDVDAQTRCAHYRSEIDIIAVKFKCCGRWFSCFECHAERANHAPEVWSFAEFETRAVLCGNCGYQLTIAEYLNCDSLCPRCRRAFNPKCANHYNLYFEISAARD